jgi:TPR repeat protein
MLYEHGIGISEDRLKAKEFYQLAAERGIESAKAKLPATPTLPPGKYDHLRWAIPTGNPSQSDEDWGSSDDFDSAKWERIMGGPEDSYFEREP